MKSSRTVIPADYNLMGEVSRQLNVSRYFDDFIYPDMNSPVSSLSTNNISRFRLPSLMCDMRDSSIQVNVALVTSGTFVRLSRNAKCLIRRIRVLIGSLEVLNVDSYNLLAIISDNMMTSTLSQTGVLDIFEGCNPSTTVRNTQWQTTRYCLNLSRCCDFFNRVLPLSCISDQLTLEIYWEDALKCLESDGVASYTLSNLELHYCNLVFPDEYIRTLKSRISSYGLSFAFKTHSQYVNTSLTTGVAQTSISLPFRYLSLNGIISVLQDTAILSSQAVNSKFETYKGYSTIKSTNLRINSSIVPSNKLTNAQQILHEGEELWYKSESKPEDYFASQDWSNKFLVAYNLSQDNGDELMKNIISGINGTSSGFTISNELTLTSNTLDLLYTFYAEYYATFTINPNASITLAY